MHSEYALMKNILKINEKEKTNEMIVLFEF